MGDFIDLPTYQTRTGQTVGASPDQTNFSQVKKVGGEEAKQNTDIREIGGRVVLLTYDNNGNVTNRKDLGASGGGGSAGGRRRRAV